jgi:sucrose-6-phosphate hydrolase SacC (GH32 family)
MVTTDDTVQPNEKVPKIVIDHLPKGHAKSKGVEFTTDFRDPNVFLGPGGYWYMIVGSKDAGKRGGVILLYRAHEQGEINSDTKWEFTVRKTFSSISISDKNNAIYSSENIQNMKQILKKIVAILFGQSLTIN